MAANCVRPRCHVGCLGPVAEPVTWRRRTVRVTAVAIATLLTAALITLTATIPGYHRTRRVGRVLMWGARWVLAGCGVRRTVRGAPRSGPSLIVGNHVSFLDILALSASGPLRMVAKHEITHWPLIGPIAARTGALFLHRDRLTELPGVVADMTAALRSGHRVQVFPEGTTRCGAAVDPFRRAPFQAALDAAVVVTPVSVAYSDRGGSPSGSAPFVGDETLLTALWRVICTAELRIDVHWLIPIPAIPSTGTPALDRKNLARQAEHAVARDLRQPLVRRPDRPSADVGTAPVQARTAKREEAA